jgi:hypothetical protein
MDSGFARFAALCVHPGMPHMDIRKGKVTAPGNAP